MNHSFSSSTKISIFELFHSLEIVKMHNKKAWKREQFECHSPEATWLHSHGCMELIEIRFPNFTKIKILFVLKQSLYILISWQFYFTKSFICLQTKLRHFDFEAVLLYKKLCHICDLSLSNLNEIISCQKLKERFPFCCSDSVLTLTKLRSVFWAVTLRFNG